MTMYDRTSKSPAAMNFGTWGPESRGRIICSISKLTIAAGSSPSLSSGAFRTIGIAWSGCVTSHSVAMPPE